MGIGPILISWLVGGFVGDLQGEGGSCGGVWYDRKKTKNPNFCLWLRVSTQVHMIHIMIKGVRNYDFIFLAPRLWTQPKVTTINIIGPKPDLSQPISGTKVDNTILQYIPSSNRFHGYGFPPFMLIP